jgi:hypothetical protein
MGAQLRLLKTFFTMRLGERINSGAAVPDSDVLYSDWIIYSVGRVAGSSPHSGVSFRLVLCD